MSGNGDIRIDQELVKALSHPIRVEILETLRGRVASPSELSEQLNQRPGVISYHAHTLVKCGCLELVHTEPRGGAVEHFFGIAPGSVVAAAIVGLAAPEIDERRAPGDQQEEN